jgi:hypothetical protein
LETTKPSRPRKAKRSKPKPTPTVKRINADDQPENKYAKPSNMVAEPLLGREQDFVTHVGLGNLQVTTANGLKEEEDD